MDTYESTDEGCAFLVRAEGRDIYHAGDLHWWHWIGEPEEENAAMKTGFIRQIDKMEDRNMDLAFMLLDSETGRRLCMGNELFYGTYESKNRISDAYVE